MKKILFLGAGFLQSFVIKRAKDLGYKVYALDVNPEAVGFKYADEYEFINIVDKEKCLEYAKKNKVDGVLNVANDYGVLTASYIAKELSLPGIKYSTAQIIKNKSLFRKKLFENNIDDIKQYYEITDLNSLKDIRNYISYPVIVKPSDGSGSRGISRVSQAEDIGVACEEAMKESQINSVIIEDYIEGEEIGIESIIIDGKPYILGILDKKMTSAPHYAELGHSMPTRKKAINKIHKIVYETIKVLEIDFGALNIDALIDKESNISIIDIGARMGGNLIGSHIIPKSTGYDYMGNLIKLALNEPTEIPKNLKNNVVVTRLLNLTPGKIEKLPDLTPFSNKDKVTVYFNKNLGEIIYPYKTNLDSCGYIVYEDSNSERANIVIDDIKEQIDNSIFRS